MRNPMDNSAADRIWACAPHIAPAISAGRASCAGADRACRSSRWAQTSAQVICLELVMHPNPGSLIVLGGGGPVVEPLGVGQGEVDAAVGMFDAEAVVPVSAVEGIAAVEIHGPGHIFQKIIIGEAVPATHLTLLDFDPNSKKPLLGLPEGQTGGNQGGVYQLISLIGGQGLLVKIDFDPFLLGTNPFRPGLGLNEAQHPLFNPLIRPYPVPEALGDGFRFANNHCAVTA